MGATQKLFIAFAVFCLVFSLIVKNPSFAAVCNPAVQIAEDPAADFLDKTSIQSAYDYANSNIGSSFTLQLSGEVFTENLLLDGGAVTLDGGYDCSFTSKPSRTNLFGTITIAGGAANIAGGIGVVSTSQCDFDLDLDDFTSIGSCAGSADDCNDNDPSTYPGAVEICDGQDNNCDGQIDEGLTPTDADGDGYYAIGSCGGVTDDCNDGDPGIHPGALEISYDGIDQDCNGADLTYANAMSCAGCHGLVDESGNPSYLDDGHYHTQPPDGTCESCHEALVQNILPGHYGRTVRTAGNNVVAGEKIVCSSCHDQNTFEHPGGAHVVWGKVERDWPNLTCDTCHENRASLHDTTAAHDNRTIDSSCGSCHTSGTTGTLASQSDVDTLHRSDCALCHSYTGTAFNAATVRQVIAQGVAGVQVSCSNCHNMPVNHHGNGASGIGCVECHGHDTGTLYDPDSTAPYTAGTVASQGTGTTQSHSTHTEITGDDLRGPGIYCDSCHDINNFPYFKTGTDIDGNGRIDLSETDVCDTCHSPGGSYDGVNDTAIGAKRNWAQGVYLAGSLWSGKEKWCAGCHDESASVIDSVTAPNVIGDENGAYTYGTGWGYYRTGHGLEAGETFLSKGGVETLSGRPVECDNCHDYSTAHIDGEARTYDDGDLFSLDASIYRQGYRLKLIDGQEPLLIPRSFGTANQVETFRVCFQLGCHNSSPFTDAANMNTNLVTDGINRHEYHLRMSNSRFASDWSGEYNSGITCVNCHNVHGSTQLAMVRDGKLANREPGLQIWYKNTGVTTINATSPVPEDLFLAASDGTAWIPGSSTNLCSHCHGYGGVSLEDRTPFQDVARAPVLSWTGGNGLVSDGVVPDSGLGYSTFTFRVSYSDSNNDTPSPIEVWVDLDDNNSYAADEKFAMAGTESTDANLFNGKTYTKSLSVAKAGDGILNYRFYAYDGGLAATGGPTADSFVAILNNAPTLAWTGESLYQAGGINPNVGGNGVNFTFRIDYTDVDNDAVSTIQVWIDEDDNGGYAASEKHPLIEVDNTDTNTSDGKRYAVSLPLTHAGDGDLSYRFYAADIQDEATGAPTQDAVLTVQSGMNSPPSLEFVPASCTTSGVKPQSGAAGADFVFTVNYSDSENEAPSIIQVWIDENDNGNYEVTEQYILAEVDSADTIYSDGKLYTTTKALTLAGDNVLSYRFFAMDGTDTAVGAAFSDYAVAVVDALKVRPAGGSGWYSTIQSAIDAIDGAHTVLVYEGTYNEDLAFEYIIDTSSDSNTEVRSVCGPDTTIINGSGSGDTVSFNRRANGNMLDGFQVIGGTTGIAVNGTQATINNCEVHDNNGPNGGGIAVVQYGEMPTLTLTNSEIYNNSSDRGGGVRIWRGSGHSISNTIIRDNTITGDSIADGGGGIHLFQIDEITISNSVIKDNVSINTYSGGGLYVSQVPDLTGVGLTVSDSIISGNTTGGGGGGVYSEASKTDFIRSSINGNTAAGWGGAIAHPSAGVMTSFENCILADNQASQAGMAKMNGGTLDIVNSTIANNQATTGNSGAIYNQMATITIRNSILWGNQAADGSHIAHFNGGSMSIADSVIQSGDDGNFVNTPFFSGNVTPVVSGFISEEDPWFVSVDDYHLLAPSPAIDNASATYAPTIDIDGQNRPQGEADDIGADEYNP